MIAVYLVSFIGGLLLAVRVMIAGVERSRDEHPTGDRTFAVSPVVVAMLFLVFGIVGYVLSRRQLGSDATRAAWAAAVAVASAVATAYLVRKWWAATPEHEVEEAYVLQGHLAWVTKDIAGGVDGEVTFEVGAERRVHRARTIDGAPLPIGTEVVIERIENDVAYVEAWAEVEKRL